MRLVILGLFSQGGRIMAKAVSLKLQDDVFQEAEEVLRRTRRSRNAYFNDAIRFYNKLWERKSLKRALAAESTLVAADSLAVLEAFEQMEDELGE
jgi:predicted transcriptional regulator